MDIHESHWLQLDGLTKTGLIDHSNCLCGFTIHKKYHMTLFVPPKLKLVKGTENITVDDSKGLNKNVS